MPTLTVQEMKNGAVSLWDLNSGDVLPEFVLPQITRHTLAVYCGASGDHNPIHVDSDFAKASGLDDVIAHGMLVMGYCSRALLQWVPQSAIKTFDTRFKAMTHVGDIITVRIEIVDVSEGTDTKTMSLALTARDQQSVIKTSGTATITIENP